MSKQQNSLIDKDKFIKGEKRVADEQIEKLTVAEIRAELEARLESALDTYISTSLRHQRLAERAQVARETNEQ